MIPWTISPQDEERARKMAEGVEEKEKKKSEKKEIAIRAQMKKRKQEKKCEAERKAQKATEHHPHRTNRHNRETSSKTNNNNNKVLSKNPLKSSAQEISKPKIGGDKERKEIDKQVAPESRPHAPPCRFDALGF